MRILTKVACGSVVLCSVAGGLLAYSPVAVAKQGKNVVWGNALPPIAVVSLPVPPLLATPVAPPPTPAPANKTAPTVAPPTAGPAMNTAPSSPGQAWVVPNPQQPAPSAATDPTALGNAESVSGTVTNSVTTVQTTQINPVTNQPTPVTETAGGSAGQVGSVASQNGSTVTQNTYTVNGFTPPPPPPGVLNEGDNPNPPLSVPS